MFVFELSKALEVLSIVYRALKATELSNMVFRPSHVHLHIPVKDEGDSFGEITIVPTDEDLGNIIVKVFPDKITIDVKEGPARNYGFYLRGCISATGKRFRPCELIGVE
jgi:diadenosine tetraphosphate (Ap4A) HIT family hydrolase